MNTKKRLAAKKAAIAWNNWKPGQSGVRGSTPWDKPEPIVRDDEGRPLKSDRVSIDTERWIEEVNNGTWPP